MKQHRQSEFRGSMTRFIYFICGITIFFMVLVLFLALPSEWNEESSRYFLGGLWHFAGMIAMTILIAAAVKILSKPLQQRKVQELEQKLQNDQLALKAASGPADMEKLREQAMSEMSTKKESAWLLVKVVFVLTLAAVIFAPMYGGKEGFLTVLVLSAVVWVTVGVTQFPQLSYQQDNVTVQVFPATVNHQRFLYTESVTKSCRLVVREHYYVTVLFDGKEMEIPCSKEVYVQIMKDKNVFLLRFQQEKRQYFQVYPQNAYDIYTPEA